MVKSCGARTAPQRGGQGEEGGARLHDAIPLHAGKPESPEVAQKRGWTEPRTFGYAGASFPGRSHLPATRVPEIRTQPTMKTSLLMLAGALLALAPATGAESKYKEGSCCDKAAKKGEKCAHPCCVEAEKENKVCAKCNKK